MLLRFNTSYAKCTNVCVNKSIIVKYLAISHNTDNSNSAMHFFSAT